MQFTFVSKQQNSQNASATSGICLTCLFYFLQSLRLRFHVRSRDDLRTSPTQVFDQHITVLHRKLRMSTVDRFRTFFQQSFWHRPVRFHAERPVCSLRAHKDRQYSLRIRDLLFRIRDPLAAKVPRYGDLHIAVIVVVGLWAAKKVKNSEDWFVGGRSMGPWITALAHGSSSLGGGMYIAGPQYGWEAGASSLWAAPGDVFGPILNFGIIARRMRKYTEKARALTIPEFFGHRYNSTGVRYLAVIILIIAMIISLLVEFMAMGVLVACITGLNYTVSLILGAIAILIYTGAGGLPLRCLYRLRAVHPDDHRSLHPDPCLHSQCRRPFRHERRSHQHQ